MILTYPLQLFRYAFWLIIIAYFEFYYFEICGKYLLGWKAKLLGDKKRDI